MAADPHASPLSPWTRAVVAGRPDPAPDAPLNAPLVPAATYHAGGTVGYGRYGNTGWTAFETALGSLDGGDAVAFASGSAATAAVLALVPPGGVVVAPPTAYLGSTRQLRRLEQRGAVQVRWVDVTDTSAVAEAVRGAALLWLETPTNPLLGVADVDACCAAARDAGVVSAVDATFATPALARPLERGADLVVHSATKGIAGHSDALLGVVVARDEEQRAALVDFRSETGAVPGALEAFLALRGLRTLPLRVQRAGATALELAGRLQTHPGVERVRYPGLAGDPWHDRAATQLDGPLTVLSVDVRGGGAAADAVVAACRLWAHTTSLGGVESTLERRRRWPAESELVPEGLLRLSVGLEDVEDLWRDLAGALDAV